MKLYGMAIAFTQAQEMGELGMYPNRFVINVHCNTISKEVSADGDWDATEFETEKEHRFPLSIDSRNLSLTSAEGYIAISRAISTIVLKQMHSCDEAEKDYVNVQLLVGKDGRTNVAQTLLSTLINLFLGRDEDGRINPDLAAQNIIDRFQHRSEFRDIKRAANSLSTALEKCDLSFGDYQFGTLAQLFSQDKDKSRLKDWYECDDVYNMNERLCVLKDDFLYGDESEPGNLLNKADTLEELKEIAETYAKIIALRTSKANEIGETEYEDLNYHESDLFSRRFRIVYANSEHKKYPKLEHEYPIFYFMDWHPDIKDAFENALRHNIGSNRDYTIKTPAAKGAPFFADVINQDLNDQARLLTGQSFPDEVQRDRAKEWRTRIVDVKKHVHSELASRTER